MTAHTTDVPEPAAHSYRCEHCDDSVPHEHLDVKALVESSRDRARARATRMAVVGAAALVATAVLASVVDGPALALAAVGLSALGWVLVTALALVVAGAARRRTSDARAVVAAALTSAGLTPLAALLVALLAGGWTGALVAGATWLAAGAVTALVRARTWGTLLLTPGEAGENARARAVAERGADRPGELRRWLVQGLLVAAAVALLSVVPATVIVLVPLAVVVAARTAAVSR
ncbi:hypothetical protein ATJ97_1037 [Georgenia soli]|uniref:Uncharacterized protein n=1 Tax=Georgenia soli TaxID=638953 RepID=A0A2A9EIY5_9MICO|nr:hypothetical protein [Georgenia soli]PFG38556.1 hypothetical protein ATJ97_1037 [Georgenia soli]